MGVGIFPIKGPRIPGHCVYVRALGCAGVLCVVGDGDDIEIGRILELTGDWLPLGAPRLHM